MILLLIGAGWNFLLNHGIDFATWITATGIVATAWITYFQAKKRLEISWETKTYSNVPEPSVEFDVTNIGSHTVAFSVRGFEKFDGTKTVSTVYGRTDLEEYDSANLSFYVNGNSKYGFTLDEFEQLYFVYVQDIPGKKYKTYPHGYFRSHLKRIWYWARQK